MKVEEGKDYNYSDARGVCPTQYSSRVGTARIK